MGAAVEDGVKRFLSIRKRVAKPISFPPVKFLPVRAICCEISGGPCGSTQASTCCPLLTGFGMLSSLSRLAKGQQQQHPHPHHGNKSPFSSPYSGLVPTPVAARRSSLEERRRPAADFDHDISPGPFSRIDEEDEEEEDARVYEDEVDEQDEDGAEETSPLLPIFSAAHLGISTKEQLHPMQILLTIPSDALPVYNIIHTIRLLIIPRCETTLSWDQLRSPQVSQFLVKPIQQQIRTSHFSSATLYALLSNCLQFKREEQMNPGSSGTSKTRALICELLAIKLLREFSTRELVRSVRKMMILVVANSFLDRYAGTSYYCCLAPADDCAQDALSYDFYPLQGLPGNGSGNVTPGPNWDRAPSSKPHSRAARISTLEVAIRAQSKRFRWLCSSLKPFGLEVLSFILLPTTCTGHQRGWCRTKTVAMVR